MMPKEEIKTYTLKEIAEHSSNDSLWLLINNSIYDVTKFIDEHPGGGDVLLNWAGKEATDAFEDVGHSSDARNIMKQYKVGELCENDQKDKNKGNTTSTCFRTVFSLLLPVAVALVVYKVYTRFSK